MYQVHCFPESVPKYLINLNDVHLILIHYEILQDPEIFSTLQYIQQTLTSEGLIFFHHQNRTLKENHKMLLEDFYLRFCQNMFLQFYAYGLAVVKEQEHDLLVSVPHILDLNSIILQWSCDEKTGEKTYYGRDKMRQQALQNCFVFEHPVFMPDHRGNLRSPLSKLTKEFLFLKEITESYHQMSSTQASRMLVFEKIPPLPPSSQVLKNPRTITNTEVLTNLHSTEDQRRVNVADNFLQQNFHQRLENIVASNPHQKARYLLDNLKNETLLPYNVLDNKHQLPGVNRILQLKENYRYVPISSPPLPTQIEYFQKRWRQMVKTSFQLPEDIWVTFQEHHSSQNRRLQHELDNTLSTIARCLETNMNLYLVHVYGNLDAFQTFLVNFSISPSAPMSEEKVNIFTYPEETTLPQEVETSVSTPPSESLHYYRSKYIHAPLWGLHVVFGWSLSFSRQKQKQENDLYLHTLQQISDLQPREQMVAYHVLNDEYLPFLYPKKKPKPQLFSRLNEDILR